MCDYSLHAVASRPAKVGEMLITTSFSGGTRGFAAEGERNVAVCLLPGTELAFDQDVKLGLSWIWTKATNFRVARFREIGTMPADIMTRSNCQTETSFS